MGLTSLRDIGVVTVARSDYGIYRPLLARIASDTDLRLRLYVSGSHLSAQYGLTVNEILADGYPIAARMETLLASDSPGAVAKSIGLGVAAHAHEFARSKPDLLVVLGDRFDMYSAAVAALPFKLPVLHIHGGEVTAGAMDDALRHSITKLSHLHCVAAQNYADRIMQLGEDPWRVKVCGALSLDNLRTVPLLSRENLEQRVGIKLADHFLLLTFHSVTLEHERTAEYIEHVIRALNEIGMPVLATLPNADTENQVIIDRLKHNQSMNKNWQLVANLGTQNYFSLMKIATAMVGNSSSGILEAPSFELPVVNIGSRQAGRLRATNVIDVPCTYPEIVWAIRKAIDPPFKQSLKGVPSPFDFGNAAGEIMKFIKTEWDVAALVKKQFRDLISVSTSEHA